MGWSTGQKDWRGNLDQSDIFQAIMGLERSISATLVWTDGKEPLWGVSVIPVMHKACVPMFEYLLAHKQTLGCASNHQRETPYQILDAISSKKLWLLDQITDYDIKLRRRLADEFFQYVFQVVQPGSQLDQSLYRWYREAGAAKFMLCTKEYNGRGEYQDLRMCFQNFETHFSRLDQKHMQWANQLLERFVQEERQS